MSAHFIALIQSTVTDKIVINNENTDGFSYDLTLNVAAGDQINFIINKRGENSCDSTNFDPAFSYQPSYQASADFTSTQGQHNWYYLDSTGAQMVWSPSFSCWQGAETYNLIWNSGGHPGTNTDAVRQWQAPQAGTIHITGSAADANYACGDGVIVSIKKGTEVLWEQTIQNGNTTGFNYDVTTTVAVGDQINFVINKRSNNDCDSTNFDPTIVYTGSAATIHWLVTDQLGTPRMIFDQSGSLTVTQNGQYLSGVTRHDYLPFGEELFAGTGGRTTAQGYTASDNERQKFTSKERDNETGLDYFGARYFASMQGRFTSVDAVALTVKRLFDPQQINLYAYTRNNPLAFIDPTGETIDFANDESRKKFEDYVKYLNENADEHAKELATVMQLQASDVNYVVNVAEKAGSGEGETTSDGKQIFLNINNVGGPAGETFSMNSRFAHEFEHGRQFDSGELGFRKDEKTGKWEADRLSYDIHDEVKAFEAQQRTSTASDYFTHKGGETKPSLLRLFTNAKSEDEKAGVLARTAYPKRNKDELNVYVGSRTGYKPGELIRPTDRGPIPNFFGRVKEVRR